MQIKLLLLCSRENYMHPFIRDVNMVTVHIIFNICDAKLTQIINKDARPYNTSQFQVDHLQ